MTKSCLPFIRRTQLLALPIIGAACLPAVEAQVELAWTARFNGPSNVIDQAQAVVTDSSGNTYVTGGADRNEPLLGGDILTVKYDSDGRQLWAARFGNPGTLADAPTAMTLDSAGNVYVTGYSYSQPSIASSQDYITIKYAPNGSQLWAKRYSAPNNIQSGATSVDYPRAIVVDDIGQVYVTGTSSDSGGNSRDYVTVKYNAEGDLLWAAVYDTPNHASDSATSLVVSSGGEIYVGGLSGLVKYGPSGSLIWTRPVVVNALGLDPSGNVIATGPSFLEPEDEGEQPDLRVTKISPEGDYLWAASYDGGLDEADSGDHVRVDGAGNIYVTGSSALRCDWVYNDGHEEKYCDTAIVMLKFDGTGRQLWAARYADAEELLHFPLGLEVDADGNSYVVGSIGAWAATVTLKFAPNGTRLWSTVYSVPAHGWDTPAGISLSPDGGVHVAGSSHFAESSSDYFLLKYRQSQPTGFPGIVSPPVNQVVALGSNINFTVVASGVEPLSYQWFHSGEPIPGATNATLTLLQVGWAQNGNYSVEVSNPVGKVVSSDARLTVRSPLNFYGEPQQRTVIVGDTVQLEFGVFGLYPIQYQWLFNGAEIPGATNSLLRLTNLQLEQSGIYTLRAIDSVSAGISPESSIRVTSLAAKCWEARPPGEASASFEHGGKVTLDGAGHIYTAASLLGVVKHDAAGNILWTTPFPGEVEGIALDAAGNVYVTGFQRGHDDDFLTIKYGSDGLQRWTRTYDGPAHDTDRATAIQVDHAGNIIVTGWAHGFGGGTEGRHQDYVTIKYDSNGNQLWRAVYDSPDHRQDMAYALAIDDANNVYVTGQSPAAGTRVWDAATVKYAPNGSQLWVAFYQRPATNAAERDIKVDSTGNVYVAGAGWGLGSRADGFIAKYDNAGRQLWVTTYNAPGNWYDSFSRLLLDPFGNILACGSASRGNSYVYDAVLVKVDANGQRLWTARFESGFYNSVKDAAMDAAGNAYVLTDVGTSGRNTFATLKYDANGNRLWESRFFEDVNSWPGALAASPTGDVFVTGAVDKDTAWNMTRLVTLKYCQSETPGAPVIVQPPQDLTVTAGSSGAFQVLATGRAPLSYRWSFHAFSIQMQPGDTAMLSLSDIQATQAGDYVVEVCNDLGCTVSPTARLTVQPVPPLLHSLWKAPQSFGFTLNGSSLFPVVIETSTDLQHWTVLSTNQLSGGELSLSFPVGETGLAPHFFRARSLLELPEESASDE